MAVSQFAKFHGLGNDFVLIDARVTGGLVDASTAIHLCDRHRGIGADGVLTLLPSRIPDADFRMHLFNADGSTAEMCGNGLRCVVALAGGAPRVDTDAGLRIGAVLPDGRVRVSLGVASVGGELQLEVGGELVDGLRVSMGNPHFVLHPFGADADLLAVAKRLGPSIEAHPAFADRTNVEFVSWRGDRLECVVFERGVGITQACGTGAGAAATAHVLRTNPTNLGTVVVGLLGGDLDVDGFGGELFITGDAVHVFDGTFTLG